MHQIQFRLGLSQIPRSLAGFGEREGKGEKEGRENEREEGERGMGRRCTSYNAFRTIDGGG